MLQTVISMEMVKSNNFSTYTSTTAVEFFFLTNGISMVSFNARLLIIGCCFRDLISFFSPYSPYSKMPFHFLRIYRRVKRSFLPPSTPRSAPKSKLVEIKPRRAGEPSTGKKISFSELEIRFVAWKGDRPTV